MCDHAQAALARVYGGNITCVVSQIGADASRYRAVEKLGAQKPAALTQCGQGSRFLCDAIGRGRRAQCFHKSVVTNP